jgi:hypothetical protein
MASGVFRPYNLTDVISTLNQQSTALNGSAQMITTLGGFAEADETLGLTDSMTTVTATQASQGWDQGNNWGSITWN